ncbi:CorA Mg2+ transport-like protein [Seiridium cupressi]
MSLPHHEELLRRVEEQHARYLRSLREFHDALADHSTDERSMSAHTPPMKPLSIASTFVSELSPFSADVGRRPRRLTNELGDRRPLVLKNTPASLLSVDIESSDDEDLHHLPLPQMASEMPAGISVQQSLPAYTFHDDDLYCYLKQSQFSEATQIALDDVYRRRDELESQSMFQFFNDQHDKLYDSAAYGVYDIGKNGSINPKHQAEDNDAELILDAKTVWDTVKSVSSDGFAAGRMTSLMDPSPLMLGVIHFSMSSHFDMDELFQHLSYMDRAFEPTELRQRSFFFVFKYYTVVGEKLTPAPWQYYDHRPADKRAADHIDICECSSILALSLTGDPVRTFCRKKKKSKAEQGKIYDPFAPWQLLNIQCYPDDVHVMRNEDSQNTFSNGPLAFLDTLAMEYRDAVKRNVALSDVITKLITPPVTFMFDYRLRDKLLFEDKHFTYSRRYFWAYNSLAVINDGIKSMINAYTETFTKEFWAGKHATLFPHPDATHNTPGFHAYVNKLRPLRHELEAAVSMLHHIYAKNEATRQEIKSLRDQLFSGSSVKESRRAIEQGDNIKILTSLSMIFLPLTFVTGVWSMTGFPLDVDDWQFPATMICACVPFLVFVLLAQTRTGMEFLTSRIERLDEWFKILITQMGMKREAAAASTTVKPEIKEQRPRRRRRFSKRETVTNSVEPVQPAESRPRKGLLWWKSLTKSQHDAVLGVV